MLVLVLMMLVMLVILVCVLGVARRLLQRLPAARALALTPQGSRADAAVVGGQRGRVTAVVYRREGLGGGNPL